MDFLPFPMTQCLSIAQQWQRPASEQPAIEHRDLQQTDKRTCYLSFGKDTLCLTYIRLLLRILGEKIECRGVTSSCEVAAIALVPARKRSSEPTITILVIITEKISGDL